MSQQVWPNRVCDNCGSPKRGVAGVNTLCSPCVIKAGVKVCSMCLESKPLDEFHRAKNKLAGRHTKCRPCHAATVKTQRDRDPESFREATRRYYVKNPEARRERHLIRKYGLMTDEFDSMLQEQNGECGLCFQPLEIGTRRTHVDHDHLTGKVRGILCHHCNTGLGNLQDDPDLLLRAALYVLAAREGG